MSLAEATVYQHPLLGEQVKCDIPRKISNRCEIDYFSTFVWLPTRGQTMPYSDAGVEHMMGITPFSATQSALTFHQPSPSRCYHHPPGVSQLLCPIPYPRKVLPFFSSIFLVPVLFQFLGFYPRVKATDGTTRPTKKNQIFSFFKDLLLYVKIYTYNSTSTSS